MGQLNITVPDEVLDLLAEMAELTGFSKSGLAAEYVRKGLIQEVKDQASIAELRQKLKKEIKELKNGK